MASATNPESSAPHDRQLVERARQQASELIRAREPAGPLPSSVPGYTVIREIGRGGMGVIYEAQMKQVRRAAALKVMRGRVNKRRLRLFEQEKETLARLNSPHIAAIYGAGRTEDGHHFFAMELVRGLPLTEYARLQQFKLRDKLRLFRTVCVAVQHAHQRGVIHFDLKPSNILVDTDGNPKILDFGLARMMDANGATRGVSAEPGNIMGTLPYMSPEQAHGRDREIDARSDIYSLGVILHELLTGRLPDGPDGAARSGRARLSVRGAGLAAGGQLRTQLRGDLRAIVQKALATDVAARYESAAALADDIDRYLASQPILARPHTAGYLLGRLLTRHQFASLLVAALVILVLAAAVEISTLTYEAEHMRLLAESADPRYADQLARERSAARQRADILERRLGGPTEEMAQWYEAAGLTEDAARVRAELEALRNRPGAVSTAPAEP